ncbi:hypothetical protein ACFL1R_02675 [Candidatus Latescibacterota bacterium]
MRKGNLYKVALVVCGLFLPSLTSGICAIPSGSPIMISSLDFENANIRQIMKTLSEIGNRNIILDSEIEAECTIYLKDVTWKEALIAVLKMNDLIAYEDRGFIKVITHQDFDEQRTALEVKQKQEIMEKRLGEPVGVHVIKIHNARAEDVKTTIDPLLGEADIPSVDSRTNSLVFTVTDSSLAVINDIIIELDTETRQVSIEVKMVTVDASSVSELGINWSAIREGNSVVQSVVGEEGKTLIGTYSGKVSDADIMAKLISLVEDNKAEIVSRPHVTTQDNETAVIRSGQQVPVITYDQARNTVIELVDASTEINVTPHILSDDRVLIDVQASRRSAEGVGVGLKINEELAEVKLITSNGETAVIGGMRQLHETKTESGIPILKNIPLIGQAFKYMKRESRKTDLIIFITPHIVFED